MMTRSIVGRFLILAVLLVSLGVIAQAALIITKDPGKKTVVARAGGTTAPLPAPTGATAVRPVQVADAAPVRVVYPGPLGDAPIQPRKITDAAPASPLAAPTPALAAATGQPMAAATVQPPVTAQPPVAVQPPVAAQQTVTAQQPAPAAAKPAVPVQAVPVQVASADSGAGLPAADAAPASGKGVNLNSASIDALNHLGGGHIGQTIVQHRPYRSVEDLMKKRVIRRSVYDQIKNQVAAE